MCGKFDGSFEYVKQEVESHDCSDTGVRERKRGLPILRSLPKI